MTRASQCQISLCSEHPIYNHVITACAFSNFVLDGDGIMMNTDGNFSESLLSYQRQSQES
jgi:uncharacterized Fe-S cluster-containing radical SAM superfamily protein